jgi:hypothetical protein
MRQPWAGYTSDVANPTRHLVARVLEPSPIDEARHKQVCGVARIPSTT